MCSLLEYSVYMRGVRYLGLLSKRYEKTIMMCKTLDNTGVPC